MPVGKPCHLHDFRHRPPEVRNVIAPELRVQQPRGVIAPEVRKKVRAGAPEAREKLLKGGPEWVAGGQEGPSELQQEVLDAELVGCIVHGREWKR